MLVTMLAGGLGDSAYTSAAKSLFGDIPGLFSSLASVGKQLYGKTKSLAEIQAKVDETDGLLKEARAKLIEYARRSEISAADKQNKVTRYNELVSAFRKSLVQIPLITGGKLYAKKGYLAPKIVTKQEAGLGGVFAVIAGVPGGAAIAMGTVTAALIVGAIFAAPLLLKKLIKDMSAALEEVLPPPLRGKGAGSLLLLAALGAGAWFYFRRRK